jgi:hypothetical protein
MRRSYFVRKLFAQKQGHCSKALRSKAGANEDRCAIDSDALRSARSAQIANRGTLVTSIGVGCRRQHDAKITFSSSGVTRRQSVQAMMLV